MVNPDAVRGQVLLEESREAVVVLDADGIVVTGSRRARQSLGVREGEQLSPELLEDERTLVVPYDVNGRRRSPACSRCSSSPRCRARTSPTSSSAHAWRWGRSAS